VLAYVPIMQGLGRGSREKAIKQHACTHYYYAYDNTREG
jgi:hypothetical protein